MTKTIELHKTDPSIHTTGMCSVNIEALTEKTEASLASGEIVRTSPTSGLMKCMGHSLLSTDPKEIAAFAATDFSTAGMRFMYAINPETREVIQLYKTKNKFAQRDVKPLIAEGFSEWSLPYMAPKHFVFADGEEEIVKVERRIDCSPLATTRLAVQYGRAFGVI